MAYSLYVQSRATSCCSHTLPPSELLNVWIHIYSDSASKAKSKSVKAANETLGQSIDETELHSITHSHAVISVSFLLRVGTLMHCYFLFYQINWKRNKKKKEKTMKGEGLCPEQKQGQNSCIEYKDDSSLLRHCVSRHTELSNRSAVLFTAVVGLTFTCLLIPSN